MKIRQPEIDHKVPEAAIWEVKTRKVEEITMAFDCLTVILSPWPHQDGPNSDLIFPLCSL